MNVHQTVQLLSERMPEIRRRFGVRELAIFGSVVCNEAPPGSDVDVLVEFAELTVRRFDPTTPKRATASASKQPPGASRIWLAPASDDGCD